MSLKKTHKLDPNFVSQQKHEVTYIQGKMKKEGITLSSDEIKAIIKSVGKSRRKVYAYIRNLKK